MTTRLGLALPDPLHPQRNALVQAAMAVHRDPARAPIKVSHSLLEAFTAAVASSTQRALLADLRAFERWCQAQGLPTLPATPEAIAAYLTARAADGAAPASLARYKASLARWHTLLGVPDPTRDALVSLTLKGLRRAKGTAQRQASPLRFKGAVRDVHGDEPRGLSIAALLASCPETVVGLRDAALLSVAYDTGLRAAELVAIDVADFLPAIDDAAALVAVRRSKGDPEGQGATAYLSPRSVLAVRAWQHAGQIGAGPLFRRVFLRPLPARPAVAGQRWARIEFGELQVGVSGGEVARPASVVYTVGSGRLTPGALTGIYRHIVRRAADAGFLPDLSERQVSSLLAGISAHSTRVGLTQDLFSAGEDLAGIMDALRWKTPRMALLYNRNLSAESGAAGRMVSRL